MIEQNELFFTGIWVKRALKETETVKTCLVIEDVVLICRGTGNGTLERFARLLKNHKNGIA